MLVGRGLADDTDVVLTVAQLERVCPLQVKPS
jgi:hypothetical protein